MNNAHKALLLGVFANLLGGASFIGQKWALGGYPPGLLLFIRLLIATPLLFYFAPKEWRKSATRGDWLRMAAVGIFGLAAPHLVGTYGLKNTDSVNAALLIGVEPVSIFVFSTIFLREKIVRVQALGMLSAVLGAALVVSAGDLGSIGANPATRANLLLALSAVLWSIYTVAAKPTLERVPPMAVTAVTSAISIPVLGTAALFELPYDTSRMFDPLVVAALLGTALLVSFAATVLWNAALKDIRATQMAALVFLQPIAGTLIGVLAGEPLPLTTIFGGLLVLAGVYFVHLPVRDRRRDQGQEAESK